MIIAEFVMLLQMPGIYGKPGEMRIDGSARPFFPEYGMYGLVIQTTAIEMISANHADTGSHGWRKTVDPEK